MPTSSERKSEIKTTRHDQPHYARDFFLCTCFQITTTNNGRIKNRLQEIQQETISLCSQIEIVQPREILAGWKDRRTTHKLMPTEQKGNQAKILPRKAEAKRIRLVHEEKQGTRQEHQAARLRMEENAICSEKGLLKGN